MRLLINKDQLRKVQTIGNKGGFAIDIMVKGKTKAKKIYTLGLHFGGLIRVVEKH